MPFYYDLSHFLKISSSFKVNKNPMHAVADSTFRVRLLNFCYTAAFIETKYPIAEEVKNSSFPLHDTFRWYAWYTWFVNLVLSVIENSPGIGDNFTSCENYDMCKIRVNKTSSDHHIHKTRALLREELRLTWIYEKSTPFLPVFTAAFSQFKMCWCSVTRHIII